MRNFRRVLFGALLILVIGGSFCLCGCDESYEELVAKTDKALQKYLNNPTEKNYHKYEKYARKASKKNREMHPLFLETKDNSNNTQENKLGSKTISEPIKEKIPETYEEWLAKAKEYESQKRWCYALGAYYDAMGIVDLEPESKLEAFNGYNALKETILAGNPGFGTFNEFSMHDEWKNLLIDAEKYGCSFNPYEVTVGNLVRESLDYTNKTASYSARISNKVGNRYLYTISIVEEGYKKSYKNDWKDLPSYWPRFSASYNNDGVYNVNGAYICFVEEYNTYYNYVQATWDYNAFTKDGYGYSYIYCKYNIVDENGKELAKPGKFNIDYRTIGFSGITPEIMDLIDNEKAFLNPVACYLYYGTYLKEDEEDQCYITNLREVQLPMDNSVFICWNNKKDKIYEAVKKVEEYLSK